MIINKIYTLLVLIIFYSNFLFSNEILLDSIPKENKPLKIYYNSSESIIPDYIFPIYIKIRFFDENEDSISEIQNSLVKAYWKGKNWWLYEVIIPENTNFVELRYSKDNIFSEGNYEYFTFNIETKSLNNGMLSESKKLILDKKYESALLILDNIIKTSNSNDLVAECIYIISEIYLNEFNEYELTSFYLSEIIQNFPETDVSKKAMFTLAYLYANHLHFYTDAINLYERFINTYPYDDLIPSIQYELNILRNIK